MNDASCFGSELLAKGQGSEKFGTICKTYVFLFISSFVSAFCLENGVHQFLTAVLVLLKREFMYIVLFNFNSDYYIHF